MGTFIYSLSNNEGLGIFDSGLLIVNFMEVTLEVRENDTRVSVHHWSLVTFLPT